MRPRPFLEIVIAGNDEVFNFLFQKSASTRGFLSKADEERYAIKDERLTKRIRALNIKHFDRKFRAEHVYVLDDWWPNQMRYIEAPPAAMRPDYFDSLRNLLTGEYRDWSIQITVHKGLLVENSMIGSMVVWNDRLLIDRKLYNALKRPLAFQCKGKTLRVARADC